MSFFEVQEDSFGIAESCGYQVARATVAEFESLLQLGGGFGKVSYRKVSLGLG